MDKPSIPQDIINTDSETQNEQNLDSVDCLVILKIPMKC
jgi:hypothetical protein